MGVQKAKRRGRGFSPCFALAVAAASACATVADAQFCHGTVASASEVADLRRNITRCSEVQVTWQGHIVLHSTIEVPSGAVLTVTPSTESATIDGTGNVQLFNVSGGTLNLRNLILTGGSSSSGGGAVYVGSGGSMTTTSCTFTNNSATYFGGGVYVDSSNATMEECTFTNNSAGFAGGASLITDGSNATMQSCTFTGNSAGDYGAGAVMVYSSNATMESCIFTNNLATVGGGGVIVGSRSNTMMESCTFANNWAGSDYTGGGVLVDGSNAVMEACTFTNNSAGAGGAAVITNGSNATIDLCTFINNSAGSDYTGGGVLVDGSNAAMEACTFTNNSAGAGGAAVITYRSNATMESCTFTGNSATNAGGLYVSSSKATMEACTFTSNSASGDHGGGAVYFFSSNAMMESCTFTNNSAGGDYGGGAVIVDSSIATMESSTFTNNSATFGGGGGGVYIYNSNTMMESCTFTSNSADIGGGGVVVFGSSSATMESCNFTKNSVSGDNGGGAVIVGNSSIATMESCIFNNNSASSPISSGAVYVQSSNALMESCALTNNSAGGGSGGGVIVDSSNTTMDSCSFTSNSAVSGGGVYIFSSNATMESCSFTNNSASGDDGSGGAVYIFSSNATIESCIFTNNSASGDVGGGGAVLVFTNATMGSGNTTMKSCTFTDNSASNGGGVWVLSSNATMESCTFTNNSATVGGGAVVVSSSNATMESCTFTNNSAGGGGGVFATVDGIVTMGSCTFVGNSATKGGGAVFSLGSMTDVSFCTFTGNLAGTSGGAIDGALSTKPLRLQSSIFQGNSARADGGAVIGPAAAYVKPATAANTNKIRTPVLSIQSCSFEGNLAEGSGGGAHSKAITAEATSFSKNTAALGGALWASSSLSTDSCVFVANSAVNGGGVYSESVPALNSTTFMLNSAKESGGGLFVLGSTDFDNDCARSGFDSSSSDSSSSDISDSSYTSSGSGALTCPAGISATTLFEGNAAGCCYSPSLSAERSCADADGQGSGLEKCCPAGTWDDELACQTCPAGFNCSALGLLNTTVSMEAGFWRSDYHNFTVMVAQKCLHPAACKGHGVVAAESSDEYCTEGYKGAYCAVCASGYSSGVAYECNKCAASSKAGVATAICLALICILGACWYVVSDLLAVGDFTDASLEAKGRLQGFFKLIKRFPFSTLRIPIVVFQILTQYVGITGARFPQLYQNFLAWVNAINLDMGWVLSVGCLASFDFYDRLLFATLAPLAVLALLGCSYGFARHRLRRLRPVVGPHRAFGSTSSSREDLLEAVMQKHVSLAFVVSFLIYSTVSTAVFQTFACDTFSVEEGGASFLRADYSISCKDRKHFYYVIYAAIMTVVYPVGIPTVYAIALWRQRGHFEPGGPVFLSGSAKALGPKGHALRTTGFLWRPYKESFFWWELVECARRLCLTGFLVGIMPGTSGQAAVACIFSMVSLAAFAHSAPLKERTDAHIYIVGCAIIFLSTFLALMIKVDVSDENAQSQQVISVLLIVLNVCMATAAILQCALVARSSFAGASESSVYGLRAKRRGEEEQIGQGNEEKDGEAAGRVKAPPA